MALTATNNGRCVAVGATSGEGGTSTGLSVTAGAATSKTSSGAGTRVAWQSFDGGEPAGARRSPVPRARGTGDLRAPAGSPPSKDCHATRVPAPLLVLLVAAPAVTLSPVLVPPSPDVAPTATQRPLFVAVSAIHALRATLAGAFPASG